MPTPTKGSLLGGSPAHQRLMLANLATSLFEYGQITTTEAKARRLRPYAEKLISKARVDTLHNRRQVLKDIRDKSVVHELFTEIGPGYATRPGGYTRITKIGPRKGDNAPMAVIELVQEEYSPKQAVVKEAEGAAKNASRTDQATAAQETAAAEDTAPTEPAEGAEQPGEDTESERVTPQEPAEGAEDAGEQK